MTKKTRRKERLKKAEIRIGRIKEKEEESDKCYVANNDVKGRRE